MVAKHNHSFSKDDHDDYDDSDDSSPGNAQSREIAEGARPPPKKRNRAALSCTLCRERKVKCDRVIPCQQCIKRGDAEHCHLDPAKRGPAKPTTQAKRDSSHREHSQSNPSMPDVSSANEVDTIKARLAQLEQALAQQQGGSPSFSIPSTSSGFSPNTTTTTSNTHNGLTRPSWATMSSDNSNSSLPIFTGAAANQFAQPPRISPASGTPSSRMPNYFAQQGADESLAGRLSTMGSSRSPSGPAFDPSGRSKQGSMSDASSTPYSSMGASSFTMPSLQSIGHNLNADDKSSNHTGSAHHRADVDSDTEDAALVLEGLAMGARNECEKVSKRDVILQPLSSKSIEAYAEDDKTRDIMIESQYGHDGKKAAGSIIDRGALPLRGPTKDDCANGAEDIIDCDVLAEMLSTDPDAEFGPDGKRIPPAKRVCILLSRHRNSLFNLVYGPETFLGWGMGWAFAAAEAAGDMMKVSDVVGCKGALQREAVLRAIIRSLPDRQSAEHLINVYERRVKELSGNCIHMPTFKKEMAAFYDLGTVEKRARVINFVDPGWLSLFLFILVQALHFHPIERPDAVMHYFDGRTIHLWRSAAQTCLVLARYQSSTSIAVLQAILLADFYAYVTGKSEIALRQVAITNAISMGLHRLGSKDQQPKAGESSSITIRREMAKRIWYQLIVSDWCSCSVEGPSGVYRIQPSQFNTPPPGNYNDVDLCISPLPAPHPMTEHTEMSFFLQQIQVCTVMREHVDMQHASQLDNGRLNCSDTGYLDGRYRGLLEQAPSFYRIGSEEGQNENTEIERWLFQQFIFDKLLRLHRPNLSSKSSARTSCVLLARSILDVQRRIRSRCSVVDRLFMKLSQSFSAAIVLCLDLLQTPSSSSMRDIVRGEVSEALQALRHVGASHHATYNHVRVIEALLEEEQARWKQNESKTDGSMGRPSAPLRKKNLLNLAQRVAKATQGGEAFKPTVGVKPETNNGDVAMLDVQVTHENQSSEQSRRLMEQLLMGNPGKPTYDEPSSFSRPDFGSSTIFDANQLDYTQTYPSSDGTTQPFDLTKFLAECDTNSSPGSVGSGSSAPHEAGVHSGASDSGHSSLLNGRSNSTTSISRMSHSSSHSRLGNNSANQSPVGAFKPVDDNALLGYVPTQGLSPSAAEKSTGLDGFWNWILAQGSIPANSAERLAAQPPLGAIPPLAQTQSQLNNTLPAKSQADEVSNPSMNGASSNNTGAVFSLGTPSAGIGSSWMNTPGLFDFALESGNDGSSYNNSSNGSSSSNTNNNSNAFGNMALPSSTTYWS